MSRKAKGNSYRRRIFAYFMAIAVVPLLILGIYSYRSATAALRRNIRQANETALIQVENQTEKALDAIRQNFLGLAVREIMENITNKAYDEIPYPEIRSFIDEIGSQDAYINYVKSYAYVNFKKGWVLSNKGMMPMKDVANRLWLQELDNTPQKIFWLNQAVQPEAAGKYASAAGQTLDFTEELLQDVMTEQESLQSEYVNHEYLTFVVKIPIHTPYSDAAFIVNLKQEAMERLFQGSIGNGSLVVFDQDGRLVYSENAGLSDYFKDNPGAMQDLEEITVPVSNESYDIVSRKAPVSGWTFLAGYNSHAAESELRQIIFTMAGIIVLVLIIIGVISGFGTFRVYRPVKELLTQVKGIVPEPGDGAEDEDEFCRINQGLHTLADHNEELQGMIDRQKTQLTELFAFRLIRGRMNEGEIQQTMARLQLQFKSCLTVVSVLFCQKDSALTEQVEQDVLNIELMKRLPEEIHQMLVLPPFIHTRAIVMVPDAADQEKLEEKLLALRNCLSVFVTGECGGYMNMGVSRMFTDVTGFRGAYRESLEALKVNEHSDRDEDTEGISMEDSSITYYGDLIGQGEGAKGYNLVLDTAIKEAVDAGDQEAAFAIVDDFLRDIDKSGVALYEQHYYLHRFLLAILTVPADAGFPIHDLFPEGEDDLFQQFNQLYDYSAIHKFYENKVIVPVIHRMNQFRKSSSEVVLEKIMDLVAHCNGDLTLSECAEKLGYHPSYIWRVLKNTRDITFTDYIAQQKLEVAKKLLAKTDLSVAEIAEQLSYSNAQNFIRLFKKHMEITPGQYRKSAQAGKRG